MIELFSQNSAKESLKRHLSDEYYRSSVSHLKSRVLCSSVHKMDSLSLRHMISADGDSYEEVEFLVTHRFKRDGAVYLGGTLFYVNISRMLNELQESPTEEQ